MITAVKSDDGSYTAYSKEYDEHYHSTKDGALGESLNKHVIPALLHVKEKKSIKILDICFGLGFNTLATLYYLHVNQIEKKVSIISPELDADLIAGLKDFEYPKEFEPFLHVIFAISQEGRYQDDTISVEVILGDARRYLNDADEEFDIIYQDAFSPSVNPMLWTREYFSDITRLMKEDAILTTYSTALRTRLALYEQNLHVYLNEGEHFRNATLASKKELCGYKKVDMEHKISCNPTVEPLQD
jgi:tRNA U34 5-methylaminomethyl-2-thiouridine-forming methyltransferase MnmC